MGRSWNKVMLKFALCDDASEREKLGALLGRYLARRDLRAGVSAYSDGASLLSVVEDGETFDVYVLDVVMPGMDGIALGSALRKMDAAGAIIYLTTSREFAVESYAVRAFHYLLKPVTPEALFPVLDAAVAALSRREASVRIKTRDGDLLLLSDIYYAELDDHAPRYVCRDFTVEGVTVRGAFSTAVAPLLADGRFFLCGASLVLNLDHVRMVDRRGAVLSTGQRLEVPRAAIAALRRAWMGYWMGGNRE